MLIHRWDAPATPDEWRSWLGTTAPFGQLVVNNLDRDEAPVVVPTHAVVDGDALLVHLARPNPVWPHIEAARKVRFVVAGDDAYVPSMWRAKADSRENGVPTSYYAAVQLVCIPRVIDEPDSKAALLRTQMRHLQPEGGHAEIGVGIEPYGGMLPGIRGLELVIEEVAAKFKYDDQKPAEHREQVARLLDERGLPHDAGAAAEQRRRLALVGQRQKTERQDDQLARHAPEEHP
jgi:transcriptional regulator